MSLSIILAQSIWCGVLYLSVQKLTPTAMASTELQITSVCIYSHIHTAFENKCKAIVAYLFLWLGMGLWIFSKWPGAWGWMNNPLTLCPHLTHGSNICAGYDGVRKASGVQSHP